MHSHSHHHHAHIHHDNGTQGRMAIAFFLNLGFAIIEFIGGLLTNSTAIMADAVHDLGDALSIGLAWVMGGLSQKPVSTHFSYGLKRLSLLSALINGLVLIGGTAWVLSESLPRLLDPQMPHTAGMFALALLGIAVNGYGAYKLHGGKTLNEKVLNWHLLEDMLGWIAVLIVSVVMMFVELPILDPILAITFSLFILFNVVRHTWTSIGLFLQKSPDPAMQQQLQTTLLAIPGISALHHLHLWSLDGEQHVLTVHLVSDRVLDANAYQALKAEVNARLEPYRLAHTTIEVELPDEACRDEHYLNQH
ncbi:cation diffusion facilitator family transporter [Aliiglaciecola sp. CAU 1673]|uniref:cation diffusion facilitator family transporter n=1 Tax=Aliiglaciecola sp. CAU 1673 TaxID=3032595 RepID=UPI0023DB6292|nr:cation diffusion facilitator family transporter [Aliiglaciecola sp. CAU 1673]MDF2179855.1 cation diffusion facilitator family transporter [Aliiglaciecola sp. CAU 1673]